MKGYGEENQRNGGRGNGKKGFFTWASLVHFDNDEVDSVQRK